MPSPHRQLLEKISTATKSNRCSFHKTTVLLMAIRMHVRPECPPLDHAFYWSGGLLIGRPCKRWGKAWR